VHLSQSRQQLQESVKLLKEAESARKHTKEDCLEVGGQVLARISREFADQAKLRAEEEVCISRAELHELEDERVTYEKWWHETVAKLDTYKCSVQHYVGRMPAVKRQKLDAGVSLKEAGALLGGTDLSLAFKRESKLQYKKDNMADPTNGGRWQAFVRTRAVPLWIDYKTQPGWEQRIEDELRACLRDPTRGTPRYLLYVKAAMEDSPQSFECKHCWQVFSAKSSGNRHAKNCSIGGVYQDFLKTPHSVPEAEDSAAKLCILCGKDFDTKKEVLAHVDKLHDPVASACFGLQTVLAGFKQAQAAGPV
jgi:hypothetical protein